MPTPPSSRPFLIFVLALVVLAVLGVAGPATNPAAAATVAEAVDTVPVADLVPGADRLGAPQGTPAVYPAYTGETVAGYVFLNSDFANSIGYSGKPIDILVGLTVDGRVSGLRLVGHHEPIVLIGIPEAKILGYLRGLVGWSAVTLEATAEGGAADIISGATVTVLVMQDSVFRAAAKVARRLGLAGLTPSAGQTAARRRIADTAPEVRSWEALLGDGSLRRLHLSVADANHRFAEAGNPEAARRPEPGPPEDTFIDLYVAQVSVPTIGRSLLGENEYRNLRDWLAPGEQAILVMGRGRYSFKGSGYVRGGIFDRIQVSQEATSVRFHDRHHHRLRAVAAQGAPDFPEIGLFKIPADADFQPTRPWDFDLLVQRATGALTKAFVTFDLSYTVPDRYLTAPPPPPPAAASGEGGPGAGDAPLWTQIWRSNVPRIVTVAVALATLTGLFFFQAPLVKRPRLLNAVRLGFLAYTLVWLGWWANAQLSVVNVLTFTNALATGFRWDYFLMDPLIFILWFATVAALLFWGRGPFCGWLCPFGALQEVAARLAKGLNVRQVKVPWAVNERLWPIKYMVFLGLFAVGLHDLALAERLSEVEPFKTSIILKFLRDGWFVAYAVLLLAVGLVIERFFCRYLCPLGGALALPGRLRMFEWLKRWPECGTSCQRCANECPVQAIHPEGAINPHECIYCMHCQELYFDHDRCPHNVTLRLKRERRSQAARRAGERARTTQEGGSVESGPDEAG
jgi:NosR/NirI family nitrous oxide reductase transcriptional regulator